MALAAMRRILLGTALDTLPHVRWWPRRETEVAWAAALLRFQGPTPGSLPAPGQLEPLAHRKAATSAKRRTRTESRENNRARRTEPESVHCSTNSPYPGWCGRMPGCRLFFPCKPRRSPSMASVIPCPACGRGLRLHE